MKALPFIILVTAYFLAGCATPPQVSDNPMGTKSWRITYTEMPFSVSRDDFIKDLLSRIPPETADERAKLMSIAESYHPASVRQIKYENATSCAYLQQVLYDKMLKSLNLPVRYSVHTEAKSVSVKTEIQGSTIHWHIDGYRYNPVYQQNESVKGGVSMSYSLIPGGCPDARTAEGTISIQSVTSENHGILRAVDVDWAVLETHLDALAKNGIKNENGKAEYEKNVNSIIHQQAAFLSTRYTVGATRSIKLDRTYNVSPEVVLSRIVRNLDKPVSFLPARFFYGDNEPVDAYEKVWASDSSYDNAPEKRQVKSRINYSASLYPEEKGRTAVVFECVYEPIIDSFLAKEIYSGKDFKPKCQRWVDEVSAAIK